ncbi:MAG TPA: electron transfer flavoprotein-ubiquinone oxidoreductase [Terriglobia bacterium]|nr:electron transfer flavoprotein-ubiquinone oxidoreductase [Terriglobia bacterium]
MTVDLGDMPERETLETDVLIVGAGPAGLSCALRLSQLIHARQNTGGSPLLAENIYLLEKAEEIGAHSLSGAVLDPRALRELLPDFEARNAPLDAPVTGDSVYYFTRSGQFKAPVNPPFFHNRGNYIISLNRFVKWLGTQVEPTGINLFPGFSGMEVLYEGDRVAGVRTDDKGIDKNGKPKSNYQPGYDLRAKVTVFAEGPRGSLTKQLVQKLKLDAGCNPQAYGIGVKELWDVPAGRLPKGQVVHTAGWPLTPKQFGGAFIYAMSDTRLSLGLVSGLDADDPRFDGHNAFQLWKTHPWVRALLEGGQMVRYGAKTVPEGGYFAIPNTVMDGALIVGDSAGFLNSQRLKGIHLAMKTGMLAAEAIFEALAAGHASSSELARFDRKWRSSWVHEEMWKVRNYHQGFEHGFFPGMIHGALQFVTGGRGLHARYPSHADYEHMKNLAEINGRSLERARPDGKLTFDKLKDVYHSATHHEEDQPSHLRIADFDICNGRCVKEYGNPCQYFCPAQVYEMEENADGSGKHLKLNPSNCVHCKTCDIADPYQIITWVCPEGGGGPHYEGM